MKLDDLLDLGGSALVLAVLLGLLALQAALRQAYRLSRGARSPARLRARRAAQGEREAADLVRGHGFRVLGEQVRGVVRFWVDGERREVGVRADLLLARGRRRFVAEVKTGRLAPDPAHGATRRQLLEYARAFDVDGVLLIDMEARQIVEVDFERKTGLGLVPGLALLLAGLLGGALLGARLGEEARGEVLPAADIPSRDEPTELLHPGVQEDRFRYPAPR